MSANQQLLLGEGAGGAIAYIEDVFSTYLYTGTGASLTITNSVDLSTKGGLVWVKSRSASTEHRLTDTVRGVTKSLASETTAAEATESTGLTAFGTTGFTLGADADYNTSTATYASWTFREQARFFDVVTYTGTGANRTVDHNLGSVPGCIIVKRTDTTADWAVYHRSLANTEYLVLNSTAAKATGGTWWNSTTPTSSVFSVGTDASVNASGGTYVAYLFAHDAGGFGLAGTDNVISCGSFTANGGGSNLDINLGYEPQVLIMKNASDVGGWIMLDTMRGLNVGTSINLLYANASSVEQVESSQSYFGIYQSGFRTLINSGGFGFGAGNQISYIAIRRGPMKVPTSGTSVFAVSSFSTSSGANQSISGASPTDLALLISNPVNQYHYFATRLIGAYRTLRSTSAAAESTTLTDLPTPTNNDAFNYLQNTFRIEGSNQTYWNSSASGTNTVGLFTRAPGFFDVVCYTGDLATNSQRAHSLGVIPELIIIKSRTGADDWIVRWSGNTTNNARLNSTAGFNASNYINGATATYFQLANNSSEVNNAYNYVAYLFATCPGVSKVGSYTGNGSSQTIACGFTAGSRFVLIKRTDSTGDWYVWDSARGIVAGNDPHLSLNTTTAEVTTDDSVDTDNSGFIVNQDAATDVNVTSATYIFLAIA